jgi:hypothetical protein
LLVTLYRVTIHMTFNVRAFRADAARWFLR